MGNTISVNKDNCGELDPSMGNTVSVDKHECDDLRFTDIPQVTQWVSPKVATRQALQCCRSCCQVEVHKGM